MPVVGTILIRVIVVTISIIVYCYCKRNRGEIPRARLNHLAYGAAGGEELDDR